MTRPRVLVAGIGNIFLGDDGFGVAVAESLARAPIPAGARVEDFGIRGIHLAYELLDDYDVLVLVDAVPLGEPAGTVAVIEAELPPRADVDAESEAPPLDAHTMNPQIVLQMLANLEGSVDRVLVVGCQPGVIDEAIGLSPPVAEAVERATMVVLDLLDELCVREESLT
jgi:hydrogenase maturation protease